MRDCISGINFLVEMSITDINIKEVQKKCKEFLKSYNHELKQTLILSLDNILVKKFGIEWAKNTLEQQILLTSNGGIDFFNLWENAIEEANRKVILFFIMTFLGGVVNIEKRYLFEKSRSIFLKNEEKKITKFHFYDSFELSWYYLLIPPFLLWILRNFYELFLFTRIIGK